MGSTLHDVVVDEARLGSVIIKSMIKDYVRAGNGTLERWAPARQAARQDGEHQQRRVAGNNGMLPAYQNLPAIKNVTHIGTC